MIINNKRELAYVAKVNAVTPILKADRLELVHINGWTCVCGKGDFKEGDFGVFFEIDSLLPEVEPFSNIDFLRDKKYQIKTQKIRGAYSQGLFLPLNLFDIEIPLEENYPLTEILNVKHSNPSVDVVDEQVKKLNWIQRFFNKLNNRSKQFPTKFPLVNKTDQERIESIPTMLEDKSRFIVTEKCDGSSATYVLEKKPLFRYEFYVCSRNRRLPIDDGSSYWNIAHKYQLEKKMKSYLKQNKLQFVCWQGEICGGKIQGNPHKLKENHLFLFHFTDNRGRMNMLEAIDIWKSLDLECVPIVDTNCTLPNTMEEIKLQADGTYDKSVCGENQVCPREGLVYYKYDNPLVSFKNVSREYLARKK